MPIKSTRISRGLYHHRWIGHVNIDDVEKALEAEKTFFIEDEINKYVSILDGSELITPPINIRKLTKLRTGDEYARIIYKAPAIARTLGELASNFAKLSVEFHDDWDDTLARAHQLISEYQLTTSD